MTVWLIVLGTACRAVGTTSIDIDMSRPPVDFTGNSGPVIDASNQSQFLLSIFRSDGLGGTELISDIASSSAGISFVQGEIPTPSGQVIGFTQSNVRGLTNQQFVNELSDFVRRLSGKFGAASDAQVTIRSIRFEDTESNIAKVESHMRASLASLDGIIHKDTVQNYTRLQRLKQVGIGNSGDDTNHGNANEAFADGARLRPSYHELAGGPSYPQDASRTWVNPQEGDRQDRLRQKRRQSGPDGVYSWLPGWFSTQFRDVQNLGSMVKREVEFRFGWQASELANLLIDDNEAIEMEITFYNYGPGTDIPGGGEAWLDTHPQPEQTWSNVPRYYVDTRFMDSNTERSYGLGTRYPDLLVADQEFVFGMQAYTFKPKPFGLYKIAVASQII